MYNRTLYQVLVGESRNWHAIAEFIEGESTTPCVTMDHFIVIKTTSRESLEDSSAIATRAMYDIAQEQTLFSLPRTYKKEMINWL